MGSTAPKRSRKISAPKKLKHSPKSAKTQIACAAKKSFYAASVFSVGLMGVTSITTDAHAAVTLYTADSSNTTVSTIGLQQGSLGNGTLNNPTSLATGSNIYKYAAVHFTAKEDGVLTLGQLSSPVDTIMILYDGVFNPAAPGTGALKGNDDTSASTHQSVLTANGYTHTGTIQCGSSTSYCPQVQVSVTKGSTYTLFVSVYNGASYNDRFDVPFDFYATGNVIFGQYTGRTPIDMDETYYQSDVLGIDVDPIFVGGTLRINEANAIRTEDFTLSDIDSNTIDANGNHVIFNGIFSNAAGDDGVITIADKTGTGGSVTFTGINTYTGSTIVGNGGTLLVSQDANLGAPSASLVFDGGTLQITSGFSTSRDILLASTGTLNTPISTAFIHDGVITGTGDLNKVGEGVLVLDGTSTNTGNININAGTLVVGSNNIIGATAQVGGNVNVGNTATLGGYGTVLGHVTAQTGGKVAPGASLGALSVGSITFNAGSTYEVDAYPDGSSDLIRSAGNATIDAGAHLSVLAGAGTWNDSTSYVIIDTTTGVTNTFDQMSTNMAFLTPSQVISSNQLLLTLTRNDTGFSDNGLTTNQKGSGSGVDSLGPGNIIYDTIVSMDAVSANLAFDNLSGEIHASTKSAMLANSRYVRSAVNRHLSGTGSESGFMGETLDSGKGLWIHTWAHDGYLKADGNAARLDNKGSGVLFGVDAYRDGTTTLGVAVGYEQNSLKIGGIRHSDADVDSLHALIYGQTAVGPIDIKGGIGYSWQSIESSRYIAVGNVVARNKADYDGGLVQIFAEGSHTFEINEKIGLTPYAGLAYQRVRTDSFTETSNTVAGFSSALHQNGSSEDIVTSTLGIRGQVSVGPASSLYADLGWKHTFGDKEPESMLNFIGGSRFVTRGAEINSNAAVIGLGANIEIKPNMRLSFGYEGAFGNQSRDHGGVVRFELDF